MADAEQVSEAAEAYIYGYPLVYNLNEIGNFVEGAGSMPFQAPYDAFGYARRLLGPETKFVSPNNDTLYVLAMLDVRQGPIVLHVPDTHDRYYALQFVDAWTNNFAYIGRRATGTAEAEFLLTDRDDQGEVPDGMTVVRAPTGVFSAHPPGEVPPDPAHVPAAEEDPGWNLRPPRSPEGRLVGPFHLPVPHPAGDGQCVIRRAAIDGTPELWIATADPSGSESSEGP